MSFLNPWIYRECEHKQIPPASIPTHLSPSFSQFGEDLIVESLLQSYFRQQQRAMSSIRYLEIGANHPIQTSNTYLFYAKHGARGILVEANPDLTARLKMVRIGDQVINLAVAPSAIKKLTLHIAAHPELSSALAEHIAFFGADGKIVKTIEIQAVSLDDLLETQMPSGCDFLSLDVEGLDLAILEDAKLTTVRPKFLMVEHSRDIIPKNDIGIIAALQQRNYRLVAESQINLIFSSGD